MLPLNIKNKQKIAVLQVIGALIVLCAAFYTIVSDTFHSLAIPRLLDWRIRDWLEPFMEMSMGLQLISTLILQAISYAALVIIVNSSVFLLNRKGRIQPDKIICYGLLLLTLAESAGWFMQGFYHLSTIESYTWYNFLNPVSNSMMILTAVFVWKRLRVFRGK